MAVVRGRAAAESRTGVTVAARLLSLELRTIVLRRPATQIGVFGYVRVATSLDARAPVLLRAIPEIVAGSGVHARRARVVFFLSVTVRIIAGQCHAIASASGPDPRPV